MSKFGTSHIAGQPIVNRMSTSAILTGLENLGTKDKALKKATELQVRYFNAACKFVQSKCLNLGQIFEGGEEFARVQEEIGRG